MLTAILALWASFSCQPHMELAPGITELASQYVRLGLPMPPGRASLAVWRGAGTDRVGNEKEPGHVLFGFLEPSWPRASVWIGTGFFRWWIPESWNQGQLDLGWFLRHAEPAGLRAIKRLSTAQCCGFARGEYWQDTDLATAIQLFLRGKTEEARILDTQPVYQPLSWPYGELDLYVGTNCTRLGYLAVSHWLDLLATPGTNLRGILKGLRLCLKVGAVSKGTQVDGLVKGLETRIRRSKARAGEFERYLRPLLDLTDWAWNPDQLLPLQKLASRGLAAVPFLIDHLDDLRPARLVFGANTASTFAAPPRPRPLLVRDACRLVLAEFAFGAVDWKGTRTDFRTWLAKARALGEVAYFRGLIAAGGRTREMTLAECALTHSISCPKREPRRRLERPNGWATAPIARSSAPIQPGLPRLMEMTPFRNGGNSSIPMAEFGR